MFSPEDKSIQTQSISENTETPEGKSHELMEQNQRVIEGTSSVLVTESGDKCSSSKCNHTPTRVSNEMTRKDIISAANELIDDLNNKRKRDTQLLDNFKKALELQVQRTCTVMEEMMFHVYEEQGKAVQQKLQELFAGIERIAKTEAELAEFRDALRLLYTDINTIPE